LLCKDCKHFRGHGGIQSISGCARTLSPVCGEPDLFCEVERKYAHNGMCGPKAIHFEPRPTPPLPRRWWHIFR
jgi:hypothetical protein